MSKFDVEKFDGRNNFSLWQSTVKDILVQQGLIKPLVGRKPETMSNDDWAEMEMKTVSTIRLCLANEVKYAVLDESSAIKLWQKLEQRYMAKSLTNKLFLKKQLYQLRMDEGTNILDHINNFNKILTQLLSLDAKVGDEDQALLLLSSLPSSYDGLVTALLVGKETLKLDDVMASLQDNEAFKKPSASSYENQILVAKGDRRWRGIDRESGGRSWRSKSRGRDLEDVVCYWCDKKGHFKRDCEERKRYIANEDKHKDDVNVAENHAGHDGDGEFFVTSMHHSNTNRQSVQCFNCRKYGHMKRNCPNPKLKKSKNRKAIKDTPKGSDAWVLDSGSSIHVCSRKDYFDEFEQSRGFVSLGDGSTCGVKGVGKIKLKLSTGRVCILDDVRYVPSMRKNLISLSRVASNGYVVSIVGGAMEVSRNGMMILKEKENHGLYQLETCLADAGDDRVQSRRLVHFADEVERGKNPLCTYLD